MTLSGAKPLAGVAARVSVRCAVETGFSAVTVSVGAKVLTDPPSRALVALATAFAEYEPRVSYVRLQVNSHVSPVSIALSPSASPLAYSAAVLHSGWLTDGAVRLPAGTLVFFTR